MPRKNKFDDATARLIVSRYLAGETTYSLAESFGVRYGTIIDYVRRAGAHVRPQVRHGRPRIHACEIGSEFGSLRVIAKAKPRIKANGDGLYQFWLCQCECGAEKEILHQNLVGGKSTSCGCGSSSSDPKFNSVGQIVSYVRPDGPANRWKLAEKLKIVNRKRHYLVECMECGRRIEMNPNSPIICECVRRHRYRDWKGKHNLLMLWKHMIWRCKDKNDPDYGGRGIKVCERWMTYENFKADMGDRPSKKHSLDRINNDGDYEPGNCRWATSSEQNRNKRGKTKITYLGETKSVGQWAEILGIPWHTLNMRLKRYDAAIAFTMPYEPRGPRPKTSGSKKCWRGMVYRCHKKSSSGYRQYGAKGIRVCKRWRESYEAFVEDMGPRPSPVHSIDRIDGTKGYYPGNCRWATYLEQASNRRSVEKMLTHNGETKTLAQWAKNSGMPKYSLSRRLKRGMSLAEAMASTYKPRAFNRQP